MFLSPSRDRLIEQLHRELDALKDELKNFKAEVNLKSNITGMFFLSPNTETHICFGL